MEDLRRTGARVEVEQHIALPGVQRLAHTGRRQRGDVVRVDVGGELIRDPAGDGHALVNRNVQACRDRVVADQDRAGMGRTIGIERIPMSEAHPGGPAPGGQVRVEFSVGHHALTEEVALRARGKQQEQRRPKDEQGPARWIHRGQMRDLNSSTRQEPDQRTGVTAAATPESRPGSIPGFRGIWSGREELNLRPLGPEPLGRDPPRRHTTAGAEQPIGLRRFVALGDTP